VTQWHLYGLLAELQRSMGRVENQLRINTQDLHEIKTRTSVLESHRRSLKPAQGRGQRAALVAALWTAATGTAWHADSIAARLLSLIGR
jgi:hypothetical protein